MQDEKLLASAWKSTQGKKMRSRMFDLCARMFYLRVHDLWQYSMPIYVLYIHSLTYVA